MFRFFGMIVGERYGIRPSIASTTDGKQLAYTLEAQIALAEVWVRSLFGKYAFKVVLIPQLQLAGYAQGGILPYRFAIALDATSGISNNNTPLAHTCTGSNLVLVALDVADDTGDNLTGITYNSVSMSFVVKIQFPADRWQYKYILVNPSTGTHNISPSGTTFNAMGGLSYTGAAQTGQPDSSGATANVVPGTSCVISTTVVATGCWQIFSVSGFGNAGTISVGTNRFPGNGSGVTGGDTNGTVGTGSQSVTVSGASNQNAGTIVAIAPVAAVINSGFFFAAAR
ncbi:MAG: hypothetical protein V4436_02175 [Patescibacteria group bacterium]